MATAWILHESEFRIERIDVPEDPDQCMRLVNKTLNCGKVHRMDILAFDDLPDESDHFHVLCIHHRREGGKKNETIEKLGFGRGPVGGKAIVTLLKYFHDDHPEKRRSVYVNLPM